jgi:hypothetical protein
MTTRAIADEIMDLRVTGADIRVIWKIGETLV